MRIRRLVWALFVTSCARAKPVPAQDAAPPAREITSAAPEAGVSRVSVGDVVHVYAGGYTTCALERDGRLLCWGGEQGIDPGNGTARPARMRPAPVRGVEHAVQVDVGARVGCVVDTTGGVACWHDVAMSAPREVPRSAWPVGVTDAVTVSVAPGAGAVTAPAFNDLCVRKRDGSADCGKFDDRFHFKVSEHVARADRVMTGGFMECDLSGEALRCWGLLASALPDRDAAAAAPPIAAGIVAAAVGSSAALALDGEGKLHYVSGLGSTYDSGARRVPKIRAAAVSRPGEHACAIDDRARVVCWGADRDMQLGDSDANGVVRGVENAAEVVTGAQHTCALETDGRSSVGATARTANSATARRERARRRGWFVWALHERVVSSYSSASIPASHRAHTAALASATRSPSPDFWAQQASGERRCSLTFR